MAINLTSVLKTILPKKSNAKATSITPTYSAGSPGTVLTLPTYREHLSDIFSTRQANDSRSLIKSLLIFDPDMSAALNAYLTVANTEFMALCKDVDGQIDRAAQKDLNILMRAFSTRFDYSTGFQLTQSVRAMNENMRYMVVMRGAIGAELLFNKQKLPYGLRLSDTATLEWLEKVPGEYKPQQSIPGLTDKVNLDIPSFFVSFFRRDPTSIYTYPSFVSAINTIAARQQVVNDLYRIMRFTGYPRIEVTILEEVLVKNAPANIAADPAALSQWVSQQISSISATLSDLRADQAFVHTDSVEAKILNDKSAAAGMNIESVVGTLNAQNQAGLRSMSTILGRGESGVNTASVEARIFAMNADEINGPVADIWSQALTMAMRAIGHEEIYVECKFAPSEIRSPLELEPQLIMKATRLKQDLLEGIISDDEYHLEMYGRIRPDSAPELSGTMPPQAAAGPSVNADEVSPNSDPLGRSLTTPGSKSAKSNVVRK